MLKVITVEDVDLSGHRDLSFSILVYAADFTGEPPQNLGGMLQIADQHKWDPLASDSLDRAARATAARLTKDSGRQWSPEEVVRRGPKKAA